jgi:tRNA(adenine34) deaminase
MAGLPSTPPAGPNSERPDDDRWMAHALELARVAAEEGEVPVGAVIVLEGRVLGEGHNRTVTDADPTAHAEVVAIRAASSEVKDWRLLDTTMYVSLEPCAMCAGAIVLARIARVVFATPDPKSGMVGSLGNLLDDERLNHRCEVHSGVRRDEAAEMLRAFFRARR